MNLSGKNLTVLHITRQNLLDADFVCSCDNCGRPIVNIATVVEPETKKTFNIGLDCKKTLIDKKIIDQIIEANEWDVKYKLKEFKSKSTEVEKFLKFCAYKNIEIFIDNSHYIIIYDNDKLNSFGLPGEIVYSQNGRYLYTLGLQTFIEGMYKEGKIKFH